MKIENIVDEAVNDSVDTPVEDVMDLFPTDHDVEEEVVADETTEEPETDESTTDETEGEESEVETTEEETEEVETVALDELELKVLGETKLLKDIPRDELQPLLQKGSDYDRVREKLNTSQDEINEWKEISEMFEMTPQEVRDTLKEQKFNQLAGDTRDVNDVRREYEANRKSLNDKMYERFVEKYPDVKVDELPQEVIEAVKSGKDLVNVYDEHNKSVESTTKNTQISKLEAKIAELETKMGVKTQNTKSKKKGVIKKVSGSDAKTNTDDFLIGLMGDY